LIGEVHHRQEPLENFAIAEHVALLGAADYREHATTTLLGEIEIAMVGVVTEDQRPIGDSAPGDPLAHPRIGEDQFFGECVLVIAGHVALAGCVAPREHLLGVDVHDRLETLPGLHQLHQRLAAERFPGTPGEHFRLVGFVQSDIEVVGGAVGPAGGHQGVTNTPVFAGGESVQGMRGSLRA